MPSSNLFAVNNKGRVFALQTDGVIWDELPYLGIDFKRVSAHDTVVWALGGDHQVYVYVYGTSVPIRVCEESYENQRWNPIESFTSNLLPSDRPVFSSIDGLEQRKLPDIHLPSLAWNWEGPWHLQDTFDGKALDKECWTYAVDFPRSFAADKSWKSYVRRRKWVRYRRYIALDTWSAVSSIHKDHTQEPFIDISVGGGDVVGEDSDRIMVWCITAFGKVMVRVGICSTCPEGSKWTNVPVPGDQDVTCLSVGRSGKVWALTWDGRALVRKGVCREFPLGIAWEVVEAPGSPLNQIAVGNGAVWSVCRDSSVWFRRGLDYDENSRYHGNSEIGTSWLRMTGSLVMVSIGPGDQVWGITCDDYNLVIRTGVTSSELTGKTWKVINLPLKNFDPDQRSLEEGTFYRSSSSSSPSSELSYNLPKGMNIQNRLSLPKGSPCSSNLELESHDGLSMDTDILGSEESSGQKESSPLSRATEGDPPLKEDDSLDQPPLLPSSQRPELGENKTPSIAIIKSNSSSRRSTSPLSSNDFLSLHIRSPSEVPDSMTSSVISDTVVNFVGSYYPCEDDSQLPVLKEGQTMTGNSVRLPGTAEETDGAKLESASLESFIPGRMQDSFYQEERPLCPIMPQECLWMWVSGSGCWVDSHNMPKWFLADFAVFDSNKPWRRAILQRLSDRLKRETEGFDSYEEAIDCSSWVVNRQCTYLVGGHRVPASLQLQMMGSKLCQVQEASLKIVFTDTSKKTILIPCCSIVLSTLIVDLPAKAFVFHYTPTQPLNPIKLLFSAEKDAEQWLNQVSTACTQFRGIEDPPSPCVIWAVTTLGDIYLHDASSSEKELLEVSKAAHCSLDVGEGMTPYVRPLERGFRPGCFVTISGKVDENAKRFSIDLMLDEASTNIALHFNPRFNHKVMVMNTREHSVWSYEEKASIRGLSRGKEFSVTILCDDRDMKISINDKLSHCFNHRVMPWDISHLGVKGDVTLNEVIYNYGAGDRTLCEYFWRGTGGHLRVVEAGAGGVTWGLSYDAHVYTFSGVCGGGIYKGNGGDPQLHVMSDIRHVHVWENQRWNPLTGFTNRGLPTDRKTWSDQSGRYERTREGTKLLSRHWQWISDWLVDHHPPNGSDKDGWQYATDFPMSYHSHRYVTDLVRRRRWVRKCRISTSGPWRQMEKVALISISVSPQPDDNGEVPVWGVSVSNEVVMREGVTPRCPKGVRWSLISSETPMKEICAAIEGGVWAVSCTGQAHLRIGVTTANPKGADWVNVDAPSVPLKLVGVGNWTVWALDREGGLYYRRDVQPLFPEGVEWVKVCGEVEAISVGSDGTLWAVLQCFPTGERGGTPGESRGVIAKRKGISVDNPGGLGWDICSGTGWSHVSARIPIPS